jgi:hypothetical protein
MYRIPIDSFLAETLNSKLKSLGNLRFSFNRSELIFMIITFSLLVLYDYYRSHLQSLQATEFVGTDSNPI